MKFRIIVVFFIMIFSLPLFSQENRGLEVMVKKLDQGLQPGRHFLVLIAVDRYKEWLPLRNPVSDVKELRDIITSRYYIDSVIELYDEQATKANILQTFSELASILKMSDSLLIMFSGHGHLDDLTGTGFWIPVNGGTDRFEQSNWLPNMQITGLISKLECAHVLIVADSCFSGEIININRTLQPEIQKDYFKKAYARISRQVLSSGASETVPDNSEFALQLKMALKRNNKPYIDPLMLYSEIRLGITKSLPLYGTLRSSGHQEGASFLLFLKDSLESESDPAVNEESAVQEDSAGIEVKDIRPSDAWSVLQFGMVYPIQLIQREVPIYGIRFSLIQSRNQQVNGVDIGILNEAEIFHGFQTGVYNFCETKAAGAQIGLYNYASKMYGVQIGLINIAEKMSGVQIGLANFIYNNWAVFLPAVNIGIMY